MSATLDQLERATNAPSFVGYKDGLLGCLRCAQARNHTLDDNEAWRQLEWFACLHHQTTLVKRDITKPADRRKQAEDLAKALGTARKLLDRTFQLRPEGLAPISDIGSDLLEVWIQSASARASGTVAALGLLEPDYVRDEFARAVNTLAAIEAAARQAAENNQKGPGRPKRSSLAIPWLADIYRVNTGKKPTTASDGPFHEFVCVMSHALGVDLGDDGVLEQIRKARPDYCPPPSRRRRS